MARHRVVRTRLSPEEERAFDKMLQESGLNESDLLRSLILQGKDLPARVDNIDRRLTEIETYVSAVFSKEGFPDDQQVT